MTKTISVAIANEASLMMVVEIIPAKSRIVNIVLGIQQTIVAVLVAGVGIIEFAVIDPNVMAYSCQPS